MRLNYEVKDNLFRICNEYTGIDQFKKTLLKKSKLIPYTRFITIQFIFAIIITILLLPLGKINENIVIDCSLIIYFFISLQLILLLLNYLKLKKEPLIGTLIIDEYGILDENIKTRSGVAWSEIEALVQTSYAIYIVTKNKSIYVYNTKLIKSMIKEMKYHKREIKLINLSK